MKKQRTVGLVYIDPEKDAKPFVETFKVFAKALDKEGYHVRYIAVDKHDELNAAYPELSFEDVPKNQLHTLTGIDVLFATDHPDPIRYPEESKVVLFPHALSVFPDDYYRNRHSYHFRTPGFADAVIYEYPAMFEHYHARHVAKYFCDCLPRHRLRKPDTPFVLISGGYLKLDTYIPIIANHPDEPDALLFCVSHTSLQRNCPDFLARYGKTVMLRLLETFPDKTILFRPYPTERELPVVQDIHEACKAYDNYEFDDSSDVARIYARSLMMVTDNSHAKSSFTLAACRPFINCCFEDKDLDTSTTSLNARGGLIGIDTGSIDHMIDCCQYAIECRNEIKGEISWNLTDYILNPGETSEYLAKNLHHLIDETKCLDWIYIPRSVSSSPRLPKEDYIDKLRTIADVFPKGAYMDRMHEFCDMAIEDVPDCSYFYWLKAKLLHEQDKPEEAMQYIQRALTSSDNCDERAIADKVLPPADRIAKLIQELPGVESPPHEDQMNYQSVIEIGRKRIAQ